MKMLSINLWYENYFSKTNMQMKTFRRLGYDTHLFTVEFTESNVHAITYNVTDSGAEAINDISYKKTLSPFLYFQIFKDLSSFLSANKYDFIYIRRLMSKLFYAAPFIKNYHKVSKLVYELPTFPFDDNVSKIYKIRDFFELKVFNAIATNIDAIVAIPSDRSKLEGDWLVASNYIDISDFDVPGPIGLNNKINLLIVANLAKWHGYDRILYAIKDYNGPYKISLTIISPETDDYKWLKNKIHDLSLDSVVSCMSQMSISEIQEIASTCHIGIGFLSFSSSGLLEISSLKHRDYAAMGLPFITTVNDYSFKNNCPYYYQLSNMDDTINLADLIVWFEDIARDSDYKLKMHEYAKDNLQYDNMAKEILNKIGLNHK